MPSAAPAARTTCRSAWMTRPRLPMSRPMSLGLGLRRRGLRRLGLPRLLRRCLRVIEPAAGELRVDATTLLGLELRPDTRDRQELLHLLGRLRAFPQPREGLLAVDVGDGRVL